MPKDWTGNYHSVCGCLGAHNECNEEREVNDFYATEPRAAELLMEIEELDTNIWECACGEGHLAKPLIAAGHIVKATDLVDLGFGMGGQIFSHRRRCSTGTSLPTHPTASRRSLWSTRWNSCQTATRSACF